MFLYPTSSSSWAAPAFFLPHLQEISRFSDYLFIWTTVIIQTVVFLALPWSTSLIHFSYWWLVAAPRREAPQALSCLPLTPSGCNCICSAVSRLLLILWTKNDHARTSGSKQEPPLYDHCFMATDQESKNHLGRKEPLEVTSSVTPAQRSSDCWGPCLVR